MALRADLSLSPQTWRIFDLAWSILIIIGLTLAGIYLPLRLVTTLTPTFFSTFAPIAVNVVFALDIAYNFHYIYREKNHWFDRQTRIQRYFRRRLHLDILAAMPLGFVFGAHPVILLRLLKMIRVQDIMNRWRIGTVQYATIFRLAFLAYWLALAAHWIACGWIAIRPTPVTEDFAFHYLRALYWTITTLATVGYGDVTPHTSKEMMYAMGVMVMGVIVYGYVIGNVANLIASLDLPRKHYLERAEQIRAFMQYRRIPLALQRRISEYYTYLWAKQMGYDENLVLADLPLNLRTELSLFLKRDVIEKVPLFHDTNEEFIRDIAHHIRQTLVMPGDFVFRKGDVAESMYFISRGSVEVVDSEGRQVALLSDGDFFGEIALILDRKRSASVRALEYCDVYVLDKSAFHAVLARHPHFAERVTQKALERQRENERGA
jgi:voltage-gated potassium channel